MIEVFNSMDSALKLFWIISAIASLVFIIQTVMTFIGFDADADGDIGMMDDAGFSGVFSFRNLINFLLGYGWSGVVFYDDITNRFWLYIVCIAIGLAFVTAFVIIFKMMMKLTHDGSFKMSEAIGVTGSVYLRIPASGSGRGKVQFSVKGSVHEIDAITDDALEIPTGTVVKIVEVFEGELVKVERI
ncbi:MAG: serine protease [Bacteroidaceae bacterium]|jgi:hypothetical protein|nr:serine protease [Bacteroidaceae bacterium]MBO5932699.1 serine protease [Bacteroidaceae bacterium]MBO7248443.1 serine protease [Bacteroidaceae bacterium]MBO7260855.1 serine protease [Bacteroidaceae bacterium]MBQ5572691.1 serine protease [Bacteroidaceae bacterium]